MQFSVTAGDVNNGAASCRSTNDLVQTQITQMVNYVTGLMGSYQGVAAAAMLNVSDQWMNDAKQLNFVLTTIADGLSSNANNYVNHETTNTTNYTNILTSLPAAKF
jgi:WXG100 family type VII secretion target